MDPVARLCKMVFGYFVYVEYECAIRKRVSLLVSNYFNHKPIVSSIGETHLTIIRPVIPCVLQLTQHRMVDCFVFGGFDRGSKFTLSHTLEYSAEIEFASYAFE